ncbi:MAG: hypothetical protein GX589_03775 [Deltaproteobacteria bacterium]|nr:hypothetical protein [Deltaproteobacteria bacterium]
MRAAKHLVGLGLSVCLTLVLSSCETSCNFSGTGLSEAVVSAAVDPETQAPTDIRSSFEASIETVYASVKVNHAPSGSKVKALFFYLQDGVQQIAEVEKEVSGSCYVSFELSPPAIGWPLGQYEVRLLLDGEGEKRAQFSLVQAPGKPDELSAPVPSDAPQQSQLPSPELDQISYKRVAEANLGFSFEMPSDWSWELTPKKDYLISGPSGSQAFEIAVRCHIVAKSGGSAGSLQLQFEEAQSQMAAVPGSKLLKKGLAKIAGVEAPFFIVGYRTKDSRGVQEDFAHSQLVLETHSYYLWLSYSAPVAVYTAYLPVFQHLVDSFSFADALDTSAVKE